MQHFDSMGAVYGVILQYFICTCVIGFDWSVCWTVHSGRL